MKTKAILLAAALLASILTACGQTKEDEASVGIIGGSDGPTVIYTTNGGHELDGLGHYTPDDPIVVMPGETLYDSAAEIAKISEGDLALAEGLKAGYQEQTVAGQLARFKAACDESDTFVAAVSTLGYAGLYDQHHPADDFYTSLYFTLMDYYKAYGPENIQDQTCIFIYSRYFGEEQAVYTEENYEYEKTITMSYTLEIDYPDTITIEERDSAIAFVVGVISFELDQITFEEWNNDGEIGPLLAWAVDAGCQLEIEENIRFNVWDISYKNY